MKFLVFFVFTVLVVAQQAAGIDYKAEMRKFVVNIANYARQTKSNFIIIPQNGHEVFTKNGESTGTVDTAYMNAVNGVGQEDLYYGYSSDNVATPTNEANYLVGYLDLVKRNAKKVLVTDYCSTQSKVDDSYAKNAAKGYISFAAHRRALDKIPTYPAKPYNENSNDITTLNAAKNFLYLINPAFGSKTEFINAVKNTNYDVLIIDAFYNDVQLTNADVTALKTKANGGKRLVISYMSIGEAENYRYYWNNWKVGSPSFVDQVNPSWAGNFKVKYWDPAWQNVIYGNNDSYTKKLLNSGFDGAYLDIIDAFEYYENKAG